MIIQMTHSISHNDIDKINKLRNIRQSIYQYLKSGTNDGKIRKEILSGADDFRAEIAKAIKIIQWIRKLQQTYLKILLS